MGGKGNRETFLEVLGLGSLGILKLFLLGKTIFCFMGEFLISVFRKGLVVQLGFLSKSKEMSTSQVQVFIDV